MSTTQAANTDAFVLRCQAWAKRLRERPITCPSGSAFFREQLLREAHERFVMELSEMAAADALDLLPKWREFGQKLARLDADLRHARDCESGWPESEHGGGA